MFNPVVRFHFDFFPKFFPLTFSFATLAAIGCSMNQFFK
ncbi:hypothetical protein CU025_2520 [Enterococcus faecium]|nr:hypothetical protein [Enterococcus faecium]